MNLQDGIPILAVVAQEKVIGASIASLSIGKLGLLAGEVVRRRRELLERW
jgi:hypothetical protein